jgi:hypothetical protein
MRKRGEASGGYRADGVDRRSCAGRLGDRHRRRGMATLGFLYEESPEARQRPSRSGQPCPRSPQRDAGVGLDRHRARCAALMHMDHSTRTRPGSCGWPCPRCASAQYRGRAIAALLATAAAGCPEITTSEARIRSRPQSRTPRGSALRLAGSRPRCADLYDGDETPHPLADSRERPAPGGAPVVSLRRTRRAIAAAPIVRNHRAGGILRYLMRFAGA